MIRVSFLLFFCIIQFISTAKAQKQLSPGEIKLALNKLNTVGSVLYIAAHPDDENTRLIAYLANEKKLRTGYLSLTRGDGGQNLIGTEQGALMGVVRTQELLEARKIDGGEQFFTRAVDFGYSKSPEETFEKWNKQEVLADVVFIIRKFRPDVIITRFPPTSDAGHGHHTASAILAEEAFDLAANPNAFPEQLNYVSVWQPKRLFLNASTWWDKELPQKAENNPNYATVDIGTYNQLLGTSYGEISAESRTKHKSQGFGSAKTRGTQLEYLQLKKGEKFIENNIFSGIDLTWNKVEGGKEISKLISKATLEFNVEQPEKIVPTLLQVFQKIRAIPATNNLSYVKLFEAQQLIASCLGLYAEFVAEDYTTTEYTKLNASINIVNRSNINVVLTNIGIAGKDTLVNTPLLNNDLKTIKVSFETPSYTVTNPYWLNEPFEGLFKVKNQDIIGTPGNNYSMFCFLMFEIEGQYFYLSNPLQYKWTDRVKGEIYRPVVVLPSVTANIAENVYVFSSNTAKEVKINLIAHQANQNGVISLQLPKGWDVTPKKIAYTLTEKNQEQQIVFSVTPSQNEMVGEILVQLNETQNTAKNLTVIDYDHITIQTLLTEAKSKVVRLNVQIKGKNIGYIMGAGDEIPVALEQLGYKVTLLDEYNIKNNDLSKYDAIVSGIRVYNENKYMVSTQQHLMNYVKNGGTYVVQYNVNRGLLTEEIGPYPMKLSRDRVTVEEANVTLLNPTHPILVTPNKITANDFNGWIQERGLYFANEWDDNYTPILEMNDPNETLSQGSLLVADYGKGKFIYTGLSFFRELPAGVPGAFRLFANIVSYKQEIRD
ncbi:MAG: LmbE family protein [Bacteroidetes bacterium HGW-Bacteroidetes-12]|nr:MAG: LmbE family protein [Bacteroidetes bacterium HGW-Bacteroidetes-12]